MLPEERLARETTTLAQWQGRQAGLLQSAEKLEQTIGEAKHRLELRQTVETVLLTLQERSHQRTVGMYEHLLTQILQEVLPNETKAIAAELSTVNGQSSMSFLVERKPDGQREDLFAGSGGSVTNVVSAGLRFIALARTSLRRFLVLDEADCWLAPNRVEAFANVIANMGTDLNVQSLMISHHTPELFGGCAGSLVQLQRANGQVSATVQYSRESARPGQLAWLRLVNFMSHTDTTVPLSAGMTVLIGQNDVGKSAIVTALSAVSGLRPFKKEFVQHGSSSSSVMVGFSDGQILECTRNAKGSPAMMYRLFASDGSLLHETPSAQPEWLAEALGIRTESGLDIQIGDQKQPVFLLNETGSKQAAILSIGKESSLITDMQVEYKRQLVDDRSTVKQGEAQLQQLRASLTHLQGLTKCADLLQAATAALQAAQQAQAEASTLSALIASLVEAQRESQPALSLATLATPVTAELVDDSEVIRLGKALRQLVPLVNLQLPNSPESVPVLSDEAKLADLVAGLSACSGKLASVPPAIELSCQLEQFQAVEAGNQLLGMLRTQQIQLNEATVQLTALATEETKTTAELDQVIEALGGICPLCHSPTLGQGIHSHTLA